MTSNKKTRIDSLSPFLKSNFFGIDDVIDSITDKIKPWYIYPDSLIRPTIINLWGMTGTGKTVLVREIANYLKTKIIQIDLGEYTGTKDKDIGNHFYSNYSDLSEKPCIILIDEFHISRTLDISGAELDRQNIRALWSLLSDGIINVDTNTVTRSIAYLDWQLENSIDKFYYNIKYIKNFENKNKSPNDDWYYKQAKERLEDPATNLFQAYNGLQPEDYAKILKLSSIKEFSKLLNKDFVKTCEDLRKNIKNINPQPKLDFTKSIVFVVGNLDELYTGSENFDPDLDVNLLKERNKNITVTDVKENLATRFRVEQISRLGNNHIIYPPLDEEAYYKIIEKDLTRIKDFYNKKDIYLTFDQSVLDIIFKEGVFPNQGARSVLSTIGSFLEPTIVKFNYIYRQKKSKKVDVTCSYNNSSKMFIFKYGKNEQITVQAQLSLDSFRIPVTNNKSVVFAVHEAGHIIASVFKLGDIPTKTSIFKTNGNGTTELSPKSLKTELDSFGESLKQIIVMLAGQAAEKTIFKDDNISLGASGDIEKATRCVLRLVQECGYTGAFNLNRCDGYLGSKLYRTDEDEAICRNILSGCKQDAEDLISSNLHFLKDLSHSLLTNSFITKEDIEKIMKKLDITCCKKVYYVGEYEKFKQGMEEAEKEEIKTNNNYCKETSQKTEKVEVV